MLDVVIVTGDAYVDHPAFGAAVIARFLESQGYSVGVIAQPDWRSPADFLGLGRPRLFVGVTAGNMDSMLSGRTSLGRRRSSDAYSPGGKSGSRPDRATIVYSTMIRRALPGVPVVVGGIEASLRRLAHYDFLSDSVRRSILVDSQADILVHGMGERQVLEIARRLESGESVDRIRDVRGTAVPLGGDDMAAYESCPSGRPGDGLSVVLPSFEEVSRSKPAFALMTRAILAETSPWNGRDLVQRHGSEGVLVNAPALPLSPSELDAVHDLPFSRESRAGTGLSVPALETVRHSVAIARGCSGGCAFCSLHMHEGRHILGRSVGGVIREIEGMARSPGWKGIVTDLGGPTANLWGTRCRSERVEASCRKQSCLHPGPCRHLVMDMAPLVDLMREVRAIPGLKKAFVASGVRMDVACSSPAYVRELAAHHVGGHLSVAPEHVSARVLAAMRKHGVSHTERFIGMFAEESRLAGKDQYLIPYMMSGHPGCDLADMVEAALWLKRRGLRPRQVQEFIPTPMTLATAMYWTGLDPSTMKPVHVARDPREKRMQKALLLYWDPAHHDLAREALRKAGRDDLIGGGAGGLVPGEGKGVRRGPRPVSRRRRGRA